MERVELKAASRSVIGKKAKQLRAQQIIPAILYGPDTEAIALQIPERDLLTALRQTGSTALLDLQVGDKGTPYTVLARQIDSDPITGRLQHVDFYQVRLTEKIKTSPRLDFVGESPAAKGGMGVVIYAMNEIEIECLPTELISSIEVDISGLEKMDDSVTVANLRVPEGVAILADPEDVIVSLVPVRIAALEEEELEEIEGEEVPAEAEAEAEDAEEA